MGQHFLTFFPITIDRPTSRTKSDYNDDDDVMTFRAEAVRDDDRTMTTMRTMSLGRVDSRQHDAGDHYDLSTAKGRLVSA